MDTQLGYWRWKLFRWNDHPNPYRNRSDLALTWLSQFQSNPTAMAEFQSLLSNSMTGGYAPTDQAQILQQLADKMATGEILLSVELCGSVALTPLALPIESAPDLSELPPGKPAPPAPAPASDPPAESTLGPNSDPVAQAEALKDAAVSGEPFCEECEKAAQAAAKKAEKAGPPPEPADVPVESTFSPENDAPAQVQALKQAAEKGVFFCEECEKARKAAEAQAINDNDDDEGDEDDAEDGEADDN